MSRYQTSIEGEFFMPFLLFVGNVTKYTFLKKSEEENFYIKMTDLQVRWRFYNRLWFFWSKLELSFTIWKIILLLIRFKSTKVFLLHIILKHWSSKLLFLICCGAFDASKPIQLIVFYLRANFQTNWKDFKRGKHKLNTFTSNKFTTSFL